MFLVFVVPLVILIYRHSSGEDSSIKTERLQEQQTGKEKRQQGIIDGILKPDTATFTATVDCITWEPVEILPHNTEGTARGREASRLEESYESESSEHRKESFVNVFDKNMWFGGDSKSGPGSWLKNSRRIINILDIVIKRIKKQTGKRKISLLDSSCGDMTWMPTFLENRTDVDFTGYDIVPANIENHKKTFSSTSWKFEVHDIVADPIPKFDIILSRHTMIHLKNKDVFQLLNNVYDSGSAYLLATNFPDVEVNTELSEDSVGRYRPMNLHLPPFNLPPPVCQANNDGEVDYINIAFWNLDMI